MWYNTGVVSVIRLRIGGDFTCIQGSACSLHVDLPRFLFISASVRIILTYLEKLCKSFLRQQIYMYEKRHYKFCSVFLVVTIGIEPIALITLATQVKRVAPKVQVRPQHILA